MNKGKRGGGGTLPGTCAEGRGACGCCAVVARGNDMTVKHILVYRTNILSSVFLGSLFGSIRLRSVSLLYPVHHRMHVTLRYIRYLLMFRMRCSCVTFHVAIK